MFNPVPGSQTTFKFPDERKLRIVACATEDDLANRKPSPKNKRTKNKTVKYAWGTPGQTGWGAWGEQVRAEQPPAYSRPPVNQHLPSDDDGEWDDEFADMWGNGEQ